MSETISIKTFRAAVDKIEDQRDAIIIKTAYLLAARNSEILTKTSPWDVLHNASKPYGVFLKFQFQDFEVSPETADKPAAYEKAFVVTAAVAKRGKRFKKQPEETTTELNKEEVIEALTKFHQTDLLDRWQKGEVQIDPLLIKVLLGNITLKVVALPTSREIEPWTYDLLQWISKHGNINFGLTRQWFWNILRENLSEILPKKSKRNIRNPLRHYRISHLIEYYGFDPYDLTSYVGWTIRSTFGQLGISASPNIDAYAHLRWRMYFPKLLKSIDKFK